MVNYGKDYALHTKKSSNKQQFDCKPAFVGTYEGKISIFVDFRLRTWGKAL